jgi:hypothetical protein
MHRGKGEMILRFTLNDLELRTGTLPDEKAS